MFSISICWGTGEALFSCTVYLSFFCLVCRSGLDSKTGTENIDLVTAVNNEILAVNCQSISASRACKGFIYLHGKNNI